jgi:fructose-1,6-bisphosphatase/inositol monophosphatase family enzyme
MVSDTDVAVERQIRAQLREATPNSGFSALPTLRRGSRL